MTEASGYEKVVGLIDLKLNREDATISDDDDEVDVSITIRWTPGVTESIVTNAAFADFVKRFIFDFSMTAGGGLSKEHKDGIVESIIVSLNSLAECGMSLGSCDFQDGRLSIWIVQR